MSRATGDGFEELFGYDDLADDVHDPDLDLRPEEPPDDPSDDGSDDGSAGRADGTGGRHRGAGGGYGGPGHGPGPRRGNALPKLIGVLVIVAALVAGGIVGVGRLIRVDVDPVPDYTGSGSGQVLVTVPDGATSSDIADRLAKADVVASRQSFVNAATRDNRALSIQPGTYRLRAKMSAAAALDALLDDASAAPYRYTISPGDTVRKVLQELSARTGTPMAELEELARNPSSLGLPDYADGTLEGYLFPSTYDVAPDTDPVGVLREAVTRFKAHAEKIDLVGGAAALGRRPGDIVIIASIIEKEVARPTEGPKVARVIYNRLADDTGRFTRLDMDSTTRYALNEYEGRLTQSQLRANNPYNTRAVAGLPPGAIANPGDWALESALRPVDGPWFFFVSMPQTRETVFAATQAEFDEAMAEYRRQGGSE